MNDKQQQNMQETFNAIANIDNIEDVKKGIERLRQHNDEERAILAKTIDEALVQQFYDDMPSVSEMDMILGLSAAFGQEPGSNDLEMFQSILMVTDALVTEQGDQASPVFRNILEAVGELSDEEFNNPSALVRTITKGYADGSQQTNPEPENPFRKKYGSHNRP